MSQTRVGGIKIFCRRIGISESVYYDKVANGYKWCVGCKEWHLAERFGSDKSRVEGLAASCRSYRGAKSRKEYKPKGRKSKKGAIYAPLRDGDKRQARARVNILVDNKLIPDPNELPCADCGHVYSVGERRHEYHHESYSAECHEKVEALCTICHSKRHKRMEHKEFPESNYQNAQ